MGTKLQNSTAAGATGGLLPGKAADPGKAQLAQVLKTYNQARGQQAQDLAVAGNEARGGVGAINEGYAAAKKNVSGLGLATKNQILKQGTANLADTQANEVTRGFGGSNVAQGASENVRANTSQQLAALDESIAQMMAGLNTGQGTAVGGAKMNLAQLLGGQSGQKTDLAAKIAEAIAGVQYQDPNAWMGQLAGIGGQLGSAAILASDERLKRRFLLVGEVDGIPIWEFEYRRSFASILPGRYRGVRAQEVTHVHGAVHTLPGGMMLVDYSMLPEAAQFKKVA